MCLLLGKFCFKKYHTLSLSQHKKDFVRLTEIRAEFVQPLLVAVGIFEIFHKLQDCLPRRRERRGIDGDIVTINNNCHVVFLSHNVILSHKNWQINCFIYLPHAFPFVRCNYNYWLGDKDPSVMTFENCMIQFFYFTVEFIL